MSGVSIMSELLAPPDFLSRWLTCLALARFSRNELDLYLTVQAQALNATVLHRLQDALNERSLVYREETLAACLTVATYEVRPAAYRW